MEFDTVKNINEKWAFGLRTDRDGLRLITFLDRRYPMNGKPYQVTTGTYYLDTFLVHGDYPLSLDGEIPSWTLTKSEVAIAKSLILQGVPS